MASPASSSIEITIGGQRYLLKGDEDEAHLREVAELVKRRVENIRKKNPNLSIQKAAMLAAFDFASQAIRGRRKSQDYRATIMAKAQALLDRVQIEFENGSTK